MSFDWLNHCMLDQDALGNVATEALVKGAMDGSVHLVALTEDERQFLLRIVGDAETGAAATARLKLRAAARVSDWGGEKKEEDDKPSALRSIFDAIFSTDGRERGECRWCKKPARVDEHQLCKRCAPPPEARSRRPHSEARARRAVLHGHR